MHKIRYNDVPFVPSSDCSHYEECQADAYNQALEDLAEFFHRDYVFDAICRDDCTQTKLVDLVDDFVEQLKK